MQNHITASPCHSPVGIVAVFARECHGPEIERLFQENGVDHWVHFSEAEAQRLRLLHNVSGPSDLHLGFAPPDVTRKASESVLDALGRSESGEEECVSFLGRAWDISGAASDLSR